MKSIAFDAHMYVKRPKAVDFAEEQSEVQAETIAEIVGDKLATKLGLKELEINLRGEVAETKADIIKWGRHAGCSDCYN
ncbi:hypothetical protein A45J_0051 [hot springs metagenome]|uniref:Uncharacterized protein n=1 Tax=hot springs metagenome TaxID=433727 RepID=A0A5J4L4D3_9ZZZZ